MDVVDERLCRDDTKKQGFCGRDLKSRKGGLHFALFCRMLEEEGLFSMKKRARQLLTVPLGGDRRRIKMPKCKFCHQKKEFYNELGYCDECLDEIRSFLKASRQRLNAWREESLTADEERRKEIGEQALALEEALHQYEKRGVAVNRKEYRAQIRAVLAHCGVTKPKKTNRPLLAGGLALCVVLAAAAVVFAVQWQGQKAQYDELLQQNEQLTMSLSDLQMQLDAALSGQSGETDGMVDGSMDGGGSVDNGGSVNGGDFTGGSIGGSAAADPVGGMVTTMDGAAVAIPG